MTKHRKFYNMRVMSLDEVGKELGISAERVRQLEDRALRKLRIALGDMKPEHILPEQYKVMKS